MEKETEMFLLPYPQPVFNTVVKIRNVLFANLPGIIEQMDLPAKRIAYCYGQKYAELICVLFPSKKGLKLAFNRGVELHDPKIMLQGKGKISRYVEIKSDEQINSPTLKNLLKQALILYRQKVLKKTNHLIVNFAYR